MSTRASMYTMSAPIFVRMLNNLAAIVDKAAAHAAERKIEPAVLLQSRLFPDMFPLWRQIHLACEFAKGCIARLAGQDPPAWDDPEQTLAGLQARIGQTIEFIQRFAPEAIDGSEDRPVELKVRGETVRTEGYPYLTQRVLPNFFFHVTTAYDILRKDGVPLGKRDFIGPV
jgi:hypothetical protein